MKNKLELTQFLLKWELIGKRIASLEQLKKGLNTFQFLEKTAGFPEADHFFMHVNSEKETANYLKTTLQKQIDRMRTNNDLESRAKEYTLSCLQMLTGMVQFKTRYTSMDKGYYDETAFISLY